MERLTRCDRHLGLVGSDTARERPRRSGSRTSIAFRQRIRLQTRSRPYHRGGRNHVTLCCRAIFLRLLRVSGRVGWCVDKLYALRPSGTVHVALLLSSNDEMMSAGMMVGRLAGSPLGEASADKVSRRDSDPRMRAQAEKAPPESNTLSARRPCKGVSEAHSIYSPPHHTTHLAPGSLTVRL